MTDLEQGTPEWLEFRKSRIGASDAPIIMGASPWSTPYKLWRRKVGIDPEVEQTPRMTRGIFMENEARIHFCLISGIEVYPKVAISKDKPWMIASLDGISYDGKTAVEIKCPGQADHDLARQGIVPTKYVPQLQHQMAVAELDYIFYFSFDGKEGSEIKVYRNDTYIYDMISKEQEFYNNMIDMVSPALSERDYVTRWEPEWVEVANEWASVKKKIQDLQEREKSLKDDLINMCEGHNSVGAGVKLCHVSRKGNVDIEKIIEDLAIDKEKYRKKNIEYWVLSGA